MGIEKKTKIHTHTHTHTQTNPWALTVSGLWARFYSQRELGRVPYLHCACFFHFELAIIIPASWGCLREISMSSSTKCLFHSSALSENYVRRRICVLVLFLFYCNEHICIHNKKKKSDLFNSVWGWLNEECMRKLRLRGAYLIIANNPVVQGRSETEVGLLVSEAGARGSKPISAAALSVLLFSISTLGNLNFLSHSGLQIWSWCLNRYTPRSQSIWNICLYVRIDLSGNRLSDSQPKQTVILLVSLSQMGTCIDSAIPLFYSKWLSGDPLPHGAKYTAPRSFWKPGLISFIVVSSIAAIRRKCKHSLKQVSRWLATNFSSLIALSSWSLRGVRIHTQGPAKAGNGWNCPLQE